MSLDDPDLSAKIRQHATRYAAPDALRAGIRTQVALAEAGRAEPPLAPLPPSPAVVPRWPKFNFSWRTAAAGFALGLACAFVAMPALQRFEWHDAVDVALVAEHVRALQLGRLTEVVASDRHVVKPWFQGRLDYAPPVFDLAAEGFPLLGGRVEQFRGKAVATLAYTHKRHVIDVFVWPSSGPQALQHSLRKGFNVLHWADASMQHWAVSDLERGELDRFSLLWQAQAAKP